MSKRDDSRPRFRSIAKQAGYDQLRDLLKKTQRKLNDNRDQIKSLSKEQAQLKADISGLHQIIQEYTE